MLGSFTPTLASSTCCTWPLPPLPTFLFELKLLAAVTCGCLSACRYHSGDAYIIDVSQSVEHDHPHALEFLRKDCSNVNGQIASIHFQ